MGDIHWLDNPTERIPSLEPREHLRIFLLPLRPDWRPHSAGQNSVRADAVAAIFERKRARQRNHACLGGAIGRVAEPGEPVHGADVKDDTRAALDHRGKHCLRAVERTVEIAVDVVAPTVGVGLRQSRKIGDAGVVDKDIDRVERPGQPCKSPPDRRRVANVDHLGFDRDPSRDESRGEILQRVLAVEEGKSRALAPEVPAERLTYAACRAGDRDGLPHESHASSSSAQRPVRPL